MTPDSSERKERASQQPIHAEPLPQDGHQPGHRCQSAVRVDPYAIVVARRAVDLHGLRAVHSCPLPIGGCQGPHEWAAP